MSAPDRQNSREQRLELIADDLVALADELSRTNSQCDRQRARDLAAVARCLNSTLTGSTRRLEYYLPEV